MNECEIENTSIKMKNPQECLLEMCLGVFHTPSRPIAEEVTILIFAPFATDFFLLPLKIVITRFERSMAKQ